MADTTNTVGIKVVADTSSVTTELKKANQAIAETGRELDKVGQKGAFKKVGEDAAAGSAKADAAQRNLIGSIQRTTAAMESGGRSTSKYYELLAQQRGVDGSTLAPYLAQLRAVELAQAKSNAALSNGAPVLDKMGLSAKQTAAALRGVPAQFTDIFTSLQGGQAPLTVLLQQGGQLKDMFGGAGNAARAMGGYVVGLINPYTLAAAAVVGLVYAYNKGGQEADAFNRALITTGNTAGATADQLSDVARAIGEVSGSQGDAAEAIAALASTGKVSTANMREFASVTVEAQRVLGKSVKDTVAEFEALGKSPVEALGKINEKYNFITAATYAQVKALEDQGRVIEAANVAQMAYAEGIAGQRNKVLDTLSDWERGWLRIKKATNGAFDSAIDAAFGREATKQQQITALLKTRDAIENNIAIAKGRRDAFAERRLTAQLEQNKAEINSIRAKEDAQKGAATAEQRNAAATQLRNKWLSEADILLDKRTKRERELSAARKQGMELGLKEAEIETQLAVIRKRYEEAPSRAPRTRNDGSEAALRKEAGLLAQLAGLTSSFAGEWDDLNNLLAKGAITTDQLTEAQAKLLAKQPAMKEAADSDAVTAKAMIKIHEEYAKLLDTAASARDGSASQAQAQKDENERIGLTSVQLANLTATRLEELSVRKEADAQIADGLDMSGRLAEIYREQAAALRERADAVRDGAAQQVASTAAVKAASEVEQFLDPARAKDFGAALRDAFGEAGNEIAKLTNALEDFGQRQAEISKQKGNAALAYLEGLTDEATYTKQIADLNERSMRSQLSGYGQMAGAAAGFFDEQSSGYQALMTASKVFHAAELAMTIAELVPKGISAVLGQGSGDPYTAFGRMAAMAAIVGALGVAIGGGISKGGQSAADVQKSQGAGVFGDSTAKSESISNSIDLIEKNTYQGLDYSAGMLDALRSIEASMSGLGNLVLRSSGVMDGSNFGIQEGQINAVGSPTDDISKFSTGLTKVMFGPGVGGAIASFINNLWGKVKQNVVDSGVQFGGSLSDLQAGKGYNQYASVDTTTSSWFGLKKKTTNAVQTQDLSPELSNQFGMIFTGLEEALKVAAVGLGLNAESVTAALDGLALKTTTLSLKDLKGDELTAAINAVISKSMDEISAAAFPSFDAFRKVGEGYAETVIRVSTNFQAINTVFESFGKVFGKIGLESIAARERLIDLSGGLEEFSSQGEYFLKNFFSEAEQIAALRARIQPTLTGFGLSADSPDATKLFRDFIVALDTTTEAGARAYVELMRVAPALSQVTKGAAEATAAANEAIAAARDAALANASALLGGVDGAFSVLQRVANAEKDRATKAHEVTMRRLQEGIDLETAAVAKRRALSDAISSTLSQSRGSDLDRSGAQAQIQAAIAIAKASGVLPSADSLKDALSVLSRGSEGMFATLQDQQRDAYLTQNGLSELGKLSDAALSVEERTLKSLEDQKKAAQASYEAQISRLDEMVSNEQAQIDELKGISTNGLSLIQAVEGVRLAILAAQGNAVSGSASPVNDAYKSALGRAPDAAGMDYWKSAAAGGASQADIIAGIKSSAEAQTQSLYRSLLGRDGDAAGIDYWTNAINGGTSVDAVREAIMRSEEYQKKLRGFAVGTNYVPANMPAMLHEGERIIPAADNRELMQALRDPQANSQVLAAAVDRLGVELAGLRSETRAVATHSEKTARLLNGVIRENAITTKAEEEV